MAAGGAPLAAPPEADLWWPRLAPAALATSGEGTYSLHAVTSHSTGGAGFDGGADVVALSSSGPSNVVDSRTGER